MFSLNQIYLLNSAKEEGQAWLEMAFEDAMEGIRQKLDDMDLFQLFRKDLFNQRDPCVILEIDRKMEMNHPLMDVQDVHKIMLANDGYEKLAEEMEDIKLSYKVSEGSGVIQLKMEFRPRPPVTPPLPESDDDEQIVRDLDTAFAAVKCCREGCTNDAGWLEGPCTGCYLLEAAASEEEERAPKRPRHLEFLEEEMRREEAAGRSTGGVSAEELSAIYHRAANSWF